MGIRSLSALIYFVFCVSLHSAISLGIDELAHSNYAILQGKKIGLVTNPSGVNSQGVPTLDLLKHAPGVTLSCLFAPEHGLYGTEKAGISSGGRRDRGTGLWIYSLYGDTRKPTPSMLKGLDAIVYDLQDVGCRSYTFISTLGYVMEAAEKAKIEVIILDRPNPLGGNRVEGPRLNQAFRSFIGLYDMPYVYGLTPGELGCWINTRFLKKNCRLTVVLMDGWNRSMAWEETGLDWIPTSPNIPTEKSARGYVTTGILGDAGIANGVDEALPFEIVAGGGWNTSVLKEKLRFLEKNGVHLEPIQYRAKRGKWKGTLYRGLRTSPDPQAKQNFSAVPFHVMDALREISPQWNPFLKLPAEKRMMFDKANGNSSARLDWSAGRRASQIEKSWTPGVEAWLREREPFLLYR